MEKGAKRIFPPWSQPEQILFKILPNPEDGGVRHQSCFRPVRPVLVGQHPLVCWFTKGAHRKLPSVRSMAQSWHLPTVLETVSHTPFGPLEQVDMKIASLKTLVLRALTSAIVAALVEAYNLQQVCGLTLLEVCIIMGTFQGCLYSRYLCGS